MNCTVATTNNNSNTAASRYESQKRRDWNTFCQYLRNHRPPLALARCSGAHVLEFLRYLDQFGKTKVHAHGCPFFGQPSPATSTSVNTCGCPLRQAWGSLDALIGRLRAAFQEHHGSSATSNPFAARAIRLYLRDVRDIQAKARGIPYQKKKRKSTQHNHATNNPNNHPSNPSNLANTANTSINTHANSSSTSDPSPTNSTSSASPTSAPLKPNPNPNPNPNSNSNSSPNPNPNSNTLTSSTTTPTFLFNSSLHVVKPPCEGNSHNHKETNYHHPNPNTLSSSTTTPTFLFNSTLHVVKPQQCEGNATHNHKDSPTNHLQHNINPHSGISLPSPCSSSSLPSLFSSPDHPPNIPSTINFGFDRVATSHHHDSPPNLAFDRITTTSNHHDRHSNLSFDPAPSTHHDRHSNLSFDPVNHQDQPPHLGFDIGVTRHDQPNAPSIIPPPQHYAYHHHNHQRQQQGGVSMML